MKPKQDDPVYVETKAAMEEALGMKDGYRAVSRNSWAFEKLLTLQLWWGRPKCEVAHNSAGPVLYVTVRPDWLDRVHRRGLTTVDGVLVLHAEDAPPAPPAEQAWLAVVCVSTADWREAKPQLTYVVKYAGLLRCGLDQEEAVYRAVNDYAAALGVEPPDEVKKYLDERGKELLATRAKKGGQRT